MHFATEPYPKPFLFHFRIWQITLCLLTSRPANMPWGLRDPAIPPHSVLTLLHLEPSGLLQEAPPLPSHLLLFYLGIITGPQISNLLPLSVWFSWGMIWMWNILHLAFEFEHLLPSWQCCLGMLGNLYELGPRPLEARLEAYSLALLQVWLCLLVRPLRKKLGHMFLSPWTPPLFSLYGGLKLT